MLIAVPSDSPGGLDAPISEHFGHCDFFTLVRLEDGVIGEVQIHDNSGHEQGGCMTPVMTLKGLGVEAMLAGGMGMRPLSGFQQVGIAVHFKEGSTTVREAVELFAAGKCRAFGEAQTCGGGGGGCGGGHGDHSHGGHSHGVVKREPIEGSPDVRDGRVVTMDFEMTERDGTPIESSADGNPMVYLQGSGAIPGLEKGLSGLLPGAEATIEVPAKEGFGEHDEEQVIEVSRSEIPRAAQVGSLLTGQDEAGRHIRLLVLELTDEVARLDANHPLAGKDLVFRVKILSVENATPDEIAHGHVH